MPTSSTPLLTRWAPGVTSVVNGRKRTVARGTPWVIAVSLAAGGASSTSVGKIVLAGLVAVGLLAAFILLYKRSPPAALLSVWLLQVFQAPLSAPLGYNTSAGHAVRQATDGLVVVLLLLSLSHQPKSDARRMMNRLVLTVLLGVSSAGFVSDLLNHVPAGVSLLGWWLAVKIWVLMLVAVHIPWRKSDVDRVYTLMMAIGVLVSILAVIDYLGHGVVASAFGVNISAGPAGSYRSTAVQAIFVNPGECSLFLSLTVAIALASYAERKRRVDLLLFLLFGLATLLTLRLKGVLSVGAALAVVVAVRTADRRVKAVSLLSVAAVAAVLVTGLEGQVVSHQLNEYAGANAESTVRGILYTDGFKLGAEKFPLGVGFGRYASDTAKQNYSPIYYSLGFNTIWGLSPAYPHFLDDTSWPAVIGESGYLGLAFVVAGLGSLALLAVRVARDGSAGYRWWGVAALAVLAVTIVNSLGTPTLFDWLAALTLSAMFGALLAVTGHEDSSVTENPGALRALGGLRGATNRLQLATFEEERTRQHASAHLRSRAG